LRRRRREDEHENLERWLITYADLITLLLAFFIMMYVFSKQDANKYEEVIGRLKTIFTGGAGVISQGNQTSSLPLDLPVKAVDSADKEIQKKLEEQIKNLAGSEAMQKSISIFTDERGVVIRILDKAFFDEGKADLKERARSALDGIVPVITKIENSIRIEGHTDNVPISNDEFKSNWELSARRATEVVRYFVEKHDFPPQRISAVGYAEYKPVASNDSAESRALNRRIEIIVIKSPNESRIQLIGDKL